MSRMMDSGVHYMSKKLDHLTPSSLLEHLYKVFDFDLDPCSDRPHNCNPNVRARAHFTEVEDGLKQPWHGVVFMNPPYGREIPKWIGKADIEVFNGNAETVVCLVAARTDTRWWQTYVPCATLVTFIKGRLKFLNNRSAPFPSALVVFGKISPRQKIHLSRLGWSVFQGEQ